MRICKYWQILAHFGLSAFKTMVKGGFKLKNLLKRSVSLFVVLTFLLSAIAILPVNLAAAESNSSVAATQRKTQKIVSVVYDNSGSMATSINDPTVNGTPSRADYALYAMKMLMSLLNEGDVLQIVPMNRFSANSLVLSGNNRQDQIDYEVSTGKFAPSGGTPLSSVDQALSGLANAGLKDSANLTTQDEDKEYWLFILTDGEFSGTSGPDSTATEINKRIGVYPSLKTIYFGFSDAAYDLRGTAFESELSTPYKAGDGDELVAGMQKIAAQLSGRYGYTDYTFNGDPNATSGDTVVINLDSCKFPIKNLSVLALNCGATLASVSYQAKGAPSATALPENVITQKCVIDPTSNIPDMLAGYSAVVNGDPYFSGGKLTLKFTNTVKKEFLSIFVEPALILSPTFKVVDASGKATPVDTDYITGGKVSKGDKLLVGYACQMADGSTINIKDAFNSEVSASVTYAGTTKAIPKGATETDITLVEGPNNITVSVNVEGVNYKMYTSVNCNILADQSSYKVVAEHDAEAFKTGGEATAIYKVFVNNAEKTPAQLKADGFTWYVEVTAPNGEITRVDEPEINGNIAYKVVAKSGVDGEYKVYFRVVSTLGWRMDETRYSYSVDIDTVEIRCTSPETLNKGTSTAKAEFTVHYGSKQLDKTALANYDVKLKFISYDGAESELTPTVDDSGKISADVNIVPDVYGDFKVVISVASKTSGAAKEYTHAFKVHPSSISITGEHEDAFASGVTKTAAKYWIKLDGVQLTKAELAKYNWKLVTYAPGGVKEYANVQTIDDDGTINVEFDVAGASYGVYETQLELIIAEECQEKYSNKTKNYPTSVSINVVGAEKLSVSQHQMLSNDRTVQFELFSDGIPFIFNNGLTTFKVLLGDKDITQYVVIDENKISYAPHADHFGGALPIGDHKITVRIDCADVPALSTSASTDFAVTKTLFEIVSLAGTNKNVERFKLKNVNATILFQVLRDGVPLPLEELQAAYDAGEIKIKDEKGTFTSEFWLPTGKTQAVKEIDGQAVIEFKVTRDFSILALDKVMGMFYFTGDKPISVTYKDAVGGDAITVQRGAVWVYILIWCIIFLIIHTIIYLLGFAFNKCKSLPSGVLVKARFDPVPDPDSVMRFQTYAFNNTFWEKYGWQLLRYFNVVESIKQKKLLIWYNQPNKRENTLGVTIAYTNGVDVKIHFDKVMRRIRYERNNSDACRKFEALRTNLSQDANAQARDVLMKPLRAAIKPGVNFKEITAQTGVPLRAYYGKYSEDMAGMLQLDDIVFFVPLQK